MQVAGNNQIFRGASLEEHCPEQTAPSRSSPVISLFAIAPLAFMHVSMADALYYFFLGTLISFIWLILWGHRARGEPPLTGALRSALIDSLPGSVRKRDYSQADPAAWHGGVGVRGRSC